MWALDSGVIYLIFTVMNEKEQFDKNLLLKCVEIASGGQELGRYNTYVYASALDLYRFLQDQQLSIEVRFALPNGGIAHTHSQGMNIPEIIEDYRRLKAKELSEEAQKAQNSTNNSDPLKGSVKPRTSFYSRLFGYFGFKESVI